MGILASKEKEGWKKLKEMKAKSLKNYASKCKKPTELFDCSSTASSSSNVDQNTKSPSKSVEDQVKNEPVEHPQTGKWPQHKNIQSTSINWTCMMMIKNIKNIDALKIYCEMAVILSCQ